MPLLGFKKQFAGAVESGEKRQTIRPKRKDGRNPHPGDTLYLYTGLRTKQCRKIGTAICTDVREVVIAGNWPILSGRHLLMAEANDLAIKDGFSGYEAMTTFFEKEHCLPFWGLLIEWEKIT